MLQYLIILLDDTSVSFCHYNNPIKEKRLISLEDLKAGIMFAMKQNVMIQFVYPLYEIPAEHKKIIETIDHAKIVSINADSTAHADVLVFNSFHESSLETIEDNKEKVLVFRVDKKTLFHSDNNIRKFLDKVVRLNILITDIETFSEKDVEIYKQWLLELGIMVSETYSNGTNPQINILTDRILLQKMNNCNAGIDTITLAPNGAFYVCPAFYIENKAESIGSLKEGLNIKNQRLYKLEYAPLCRSCDAYHCKRCVWLNRKTTLEVNTPSHEQCVVAHLERNASEYLLKDLKSRGYFTDVEILAINYLDPFEVREQ